MFTTFAVRSDLEVLLKTEAFDGRPDAFVFALSFDDVGLSVVSSLCSLVARVNAAGGSGTSGFCVARGLSDAIAAGSESCCQSLARGYAMEQASIRVSDVEPGAMRDRSTAGRSAWEVGTSPTREAVGGLRTKKLGGKMLEGSRVNPGVAVTVANDGAAATGRRAFSSGGDTRRTKKQ
jgi:hypothetical protein